MTVPRELTAGAGGVVLQQPAREIEHHYASVRVGKTRWRLPVIPALTLLLTVSKARLPRPLMASSRLAFMPAEGELPSHFEMRFTDEGRASASCGRTVRWEPVDEVRNVRIVGDVSSVEVFGTMARSCSRRASIPRPMV